MKCDIHRNREAIGTCMTCSRGTCPECKVALQGILYCKSCVESGKYLLKISVQPNGISYQPAPVQFSLKCTNHLDIDAIGACLKCGRGVCQACMIRHENKIYCNNCLTTRKTPISFPVEKTETRTFYYWMYR